MTEPAWRRGSATREEQEPRLHSGHAFESALHLYMGGIELDDQVAGGT